MRARGLRVLGPPTAFSHPRCVQSSCVRTHWSLQPRVWCGLRASAPPWSRCVSACLLTLPPPPPTHTSYRVASDLATHGAPPLLPQAYGTVDADGSRFLLGDFAGRLHLLVLQRGELVRGVGGGPLRAVRAARMTVGSSSELRWVHAGRRCILCSICPCIEVHIGGASAPRRSKHRRRGRPAAGDTGQDAPAILSGVPGQRRRVCGQRAGGLAAGQVRDAALACVKAPSSGLSQGASSQPGPGMHTACAASSMHEVHPRHLCRLHGSPPDPAQSASFVEVLDVMPSLGPIVDFCVVDLERQGQGQVRSSGGGERPSPSTRSSPSTHRVARLLCRLVLLNACVIPLLPGRHLQRRGRGRLCPHRAQWHWAAGAGGGGTARDQGAVEPS